jgi:hypothetical protein
MADVEVVFPGLRGMPHRLTYRARVRDRVFPGLRGMPHRLTYRARVRDGTGLGGQGQG